jgi:hypothetical protein
MKMTIQESLRNHYNPPNDFQSDREWVIIEELASGVGFIDRRIDLFAINCWPSKRLTRIAHEIKISVGDFKKEISQPNKREPFVRFANKFYFVTPSGLLAKYYDQIPVGCGLMEIINDKPKVIIESDYNECQPTWEFVIAIARRLKKEVPDGKD